MVIGFKETSYSVDEDNADFQVCVVATMPAQSDPLNRTFTLSVSTSPGTAGMDYFLINMQLTIVMKLVVHV